MKEKVKSFLALCLFSAISLGLQAQQVEGKDNEAKKTEQAKELGNLPLQKTQERRETPKDMLISSTPAVFYLVNDKAVSREEYMEYLQNKARLEEKESPKQNP